MWLLGWTVHSPIVVGRILLLTLLLLTFRDSVQIIAYSFSPIENAFLLLTSLLNLKLCDCLMNPSPRWLRTARLLAAEGTLSLSQLKK